MAKRIWRHLPVRSITINGEQFTLRKSTKTMGDVIDALERQGWFVWKQTCAMGHVIITADPPHKPL